MGCGLEGEEKSERMGERVGKESGGVERNGEVWERQRGGKGVQGKARPVQERETEGSQCHGSTTCAAVVPTHHTPAVVLAAPALVHAAPALVMWCCCAAADLVALGSKRGRTRRAARHEGMPPCLPALMYHVSRVGPRCSRSHGRRRAATRACGGRGSSDVYVLESDVVSCCLCLEECVLRSLSFWSRISALHRVKLV